MTQTRVYISIDLKSFYASVECRERGLDPLTAKLVVADESRTDKTICLAVSPALKAYGIPGRCRLFEVKQKVREVSARTGEKIEFIAAVPRMALYMKYSTQIYNIYLKYIAPEDIHVYSIDEIETIPAVIKNFVFFAEEKWKIASDKSGSGNTANIGSIKRIDDILSGNGVFAKAGEELFDDYWTNFHKIDILANGKRKKISSFEEYLQYRGLPLELNNPTATKRKA